MPNPLDSQNELSDEGLVPGEIQRFELFCLGGTTQYVHLKGENGSLRNYRIETPCGALVTYEFPQ